MSAHRGLVAGAVLALLTLVGCSGSDDVSSKGAATAVRELAASITDADAVRPSGVLLAAVVLATGDIEAAVADGLVSPEEVDAAVAAVTAGDLDRWRVAAESRSR